ncbi:hypothetical protein RRG08_027622 [Elysia crispata]|uniref:Uncharacterized protein n=1 Tax=Elysia crispata TaxID=231223 RepID=A0AAE1AG62_9GAST|nr:hypothetical protein RRG08_027622 [Elysia crispata]
MGNFFCADFLILIAFKQALSPSSPNTKLIKFVNFTQEGLGAGLWDMNSPMTSTHIAPPLHPPTRAPQKVCGHRSSLAALASSDKTDVDKLRLWKLQLMY